RVKMMSDELLSNYDSSLTILILGWEKLDQLDLVSLLIVLQLVDQAASDHDAEAAFAQSHFLSHLQVAERIPLLGCMWQILRVESRPRVADADRDFFRVDPIGHGDNPVNLVPVA